MAIAAAYVAGVAFIRNRVRHIRELHARGERVWARDSVIVWCIILGGPTVIVALALLAR